VAVGGGPSVAVRRGVAVGSSLTSVGVGKGVSVGVRDGVGVGDRLTAGVGVGVEPERGQPRQPKSTMEHSTATMVTRPRTESIRIAAELYPETERCQIRC
jgi:hypothetical protein